MFKHIVTTFLVIFLLSLISFLSYAQPQGIHLSWNSDHKRATEHSMVVTWTNDVAYAGIVQFGQDKEKLSSVKATSHFSDSAKTFIYSAVLKRLRTGTTYVYRCGTENNWSDMYSFKTAPRFGSTEKFLVGVWGDTQDNQFNEQFQKTADIVQQLKNYPIDFSIHMGDIVDNGSKAASWKGLFNTTQPVNVKAPFMPVTGNHDVDNDSTRAGYQKPFPVYYEFLHLPRNSIDYSFNYGNTHFVAISSGHAKGAEHAGNFTYAPGSPEYRWLEKDLAKARKDKKITWIIVYMHHPLYSFGWSHVAGWQQRITPLMDKYKVDLCMAGHRHVYERHRPIRNNMVMSQPDNHMYLKPQGTVYITNGTAGGSPQGLGGENMPSMIFTNKLKMYNYAIMGIEGNTITYEVYDQQGEKIDYFKLTK